MEEIKKIMEENRNDVDDTNNNLEDKSWLRDDAICLAPNSLRDREVWGCIDKQKTFSMS